MLDLLITGRYYHSLGWDSLETAIASIGILKGEIVFIGSDKPDAKQHIVLKENEFLIPGFVDTHIHAPQYQFAGTGYDLPLLDWLQKYTFPAESRFSDPNHAANIYEQIVNKTLKSGTTTCSYYATIHKDSSLLLAKICLEKGQRCLVGKVSMDTNSPEYYTESTESSMNDNLEFLEEIRKLESGLVQPCITPRFAPSCTSELLGYLGDLGTTNSLPIQTHISENQKEIEWVLDLFKGCSSYTDVYEKHNLLNSHTILAHGIYLKEDELKVIKKLDCGISHCPLSNFMLASGVLDVEKLYGMGIDKIGLGSDCAGGYAISIIEQMRQSIIANRVIKIINNSEKSVVNPVEGRNGIGYKQAFYMATFGGSKVLNLQDKIGNFAVGRRFDALICNFNDILSEGLDDQSKFEKFIMLGSQQNIGQVFVDGRKVA